MNTRIVIVGAGGHGRVVADMIDLLNNQNNINKTNIVGFLDDDIRLKGKIINKKPVLGPIKNLKDIEYDEVVITIGDNVLRRKLFVDFLSHGKRFSVICHPNSIISPNVEIGQGSQIVGGVVVNTGTRIGQNTIINTGCTIDHDNWIGDHVHTAPGVHLGGDVVVGDDTFIGMGAIVAPRCKIGKGCTIGAGSVVLKDIPDGEFVFGTPAKPYFKLQKKKLIIVGAGDFGREVFNWAIDVRKKNGWEIIGFLDSNLHAQKGFSNLPPIIGNPMEYQPHENELFICAIARPKLRIEICRRLKEAGAIFTKLVHDTAIIGQNTVIEEGCIICPRVTITTDVHIGKNVILNVGATVGHDAVIGEGSTINSHVDVTGFATLGKGVFLGSHAVILPNAQVGDFATVCAGSVVLRRVQPGVTVMGVPAVEAGGFKTFQNNYRLKIKP